MNATLTDSRARRAKLAAPVEQPAETNAGPILHLPTMEDCTSYANALRAARAAAIMSDPLLAAHARAVVSARRWESVEGRALAGKSSNGRANPAKLAAARQRLNAVELAIWTDLSDDVPTVDETLFTPYTRDDRWAPGAVKTSRVAISQESLQGSIDKHARTLRNPRVPEHMRALADRSIAACLRSAGSLGYAIDDPRKVASAA